MAYTVQKQVMLRRKLEQNGIQKSGHKILCQSPLDSAFLETVFWNILMVEPQSSEIHLLGKKLWLLFRKLCH